MRYPVEPFTPAERARLAPYFSNLDRPVFALTNLPETVKAALFARYSRYPGTLRRLFLDEFAGTVPAPSAAEPPASARAEALFERVFVGYGDDSVAQLGGAHVACEWPSNVLTKLIQRPRLAAYLEQSTRYIAYDEPIADGRYRYYRAERLGAAYDEAMTALFASYRDVLGAMTRWYAQRFPAPDGVPEAAHARAIRAKALDAARGLLPAGALSHMGIYASGQSYEQLILRLLAHPLPEAQQYGEWILDAVRAVMPSFVARVPQPERGGRWVAFLRERRAAEAALGEQLGLEDAPAGPSVRLLAVSGDEEDVLCASVFEAAAASEDAIRAAVRRMSAAERAAAFRALVPERANRRHRPNRGFERVRYRFEVVSDYGAFRDLQRHRMLTVQWQRFAPVLGADVPPDVEAAGHAAAYRAALDVSRAAHGELVARGLEEEAAYALCFAYRIRYVLDLDAREAMHLVELRSGVQGHASYRAVALAMHRRIAEVHPGIAAAMAHVDVRSEPRVERLAAEVRDVTARRTR